MSIIIIKVALLNLLKFITWIPVQAAGMTNIDGRLVVILRLDQRGMQLFRLIDSRSLF